MKKIKIKKINLENFKGCKEFSFIPGGNDCSVFGDNATGKTTLYDAFCWCMFGKDSLNHADFDIKGLDEVGEPVHNLEHSVECELDIDGESLVLKRVLSEKWTRKRGSASKEFTGHVTDYYINGNGVPSKKKEYEANISEVIDEQAFRLLTDPRFFNEKLHWQKKRELLLEVCGDITDQDVIATNPDLEKLPTILAERSIEDHKKIITGQRKKINEDLQNIPVRIDEATKSKKVVDTPAETVKTKLQDLNEHKAKLVQEIEDLKNDGGLSQKRIELQNIIADIKFAENKFEQEKDAQIQEEKKKLGPLEDQMVECETYIRKIHADINDKTAWISRQDEKLSNLREEWNAVNDKQFEFSDICPTCGQMIPENQKQEALEKFNLEKAEKLKEINQEGKAIAAEKNMVKSHLGKQDEKSSEYQNNLFIVENNIKAIKKSIETIQDKRMATILLYSQRDQIENGINNCSETSSDTTEQTAKIHALDEQIEACQVLLVQIDQNKDIDKRIEELTAQEKSLAAEFERLEGELFLIEEFTRAKVSMLDEKINSRFKLARFRLFDDQINGGLTPTCITTLNGVPYSSINSAGRTQIGLDIINTLQQHYGVSATIFVDNRESIVELPEMDCQIVSLIVSEKDQELRVE